MEKSIKAVLLTLLLAALLPLASQGASLVGISISGANTVAENTVSNYTLRAVYSDRTTADVTKTASWFKNSPYLTLSQGVLAALEVPSDQSLVISASFTVAGITKWATKKITVTNAVPPITGSHAGRFSAYAGTKTCLTCHMAEAQEVHASVHYQWKGSTVNLVNDDGKPKGKYGGLNDFCISPDVNWIGKVTNTRGEVVDAGCAKCHTGLGAKPEPVATQAQLENIDCLICHSGSYKRKVGLVNGENRFVPDEASMGVTILQAASDITKPTKDTCLNCHSKAGGGNNFKRGDLEEAHRNPTPDFDVHMASTASGGAGLSCLDCHTAANHRIAGRGTDLREIDSPTKVACENCHTAAPHSTARLNKHAQKINCTVCHIPQYAVKAPTDMYRDWSVPGDLVTATGLYEPHMDKSSNVVPEYLFYNGKSKIYELGQAAVPGPSGFVSMAAPVGDIKDPLAKIYAFKRHQARQPMDPVTKRLLPVKFGIFASTNNTSSAIATAVNEIGWGYTSHTFANTERYMGIFHEVAPKALALSCTSCHTATGTGRIDFDALGYKPNATYNNKPLCASCHSDESRAWSASQLFTNVHSKHVDGERYNCDRCHSFSR